MTEEKIITVPETDVKPEITDKKKKKKKKEFRRVKSVSPMTMIVPYIMKNRIGAQNMFSDAFDVEKLDEYIKEKKAQGLERFTYMHAIIAAYVRTISQRPALNRFIRGQRIYTREHVEVSLDIKREMTLESPDTVVKVLIPKDATAEEIYKAFDSVIEEYRNSPGGDFDNTAKVLSYIPGLVLKFAIWFLNLLDYFGLIPGFLTKVSPFHCSFFITSMGSLGIPPIYHHLYDFGTCPSFCAFGAGRRVNELDSKGNVVRKKYIDMNFVLDERICDGFYYASCFRIIRRCLRDPWSLDVPPEKVIEDIP